MFSDSVILSGKFLFRCFDRHGRLKWEDVATNIVTTVGGNLLLGNCFGSVAAVAGWYLGLVDGATAPTYALADTMASHAGWTEFTGYSSPAARAAIAWAAAANKQITTSAALSFTISAATGTINGGFCVSDSTIGGTAGTLYNESTFTGGAQAVASSDVVNVNITLGC